MFEPEKNYSIFSRCEDCEYFKNGFFFRYCDFHYCETDYDYGCLFHKTKEEDEREEYEEEYKEEKPVIRRELSEAPNQNGCLALILLLVLFAIVIASGERNKKVKKPSPTKKIEQVLIITHKNITLAQAEQYTFSLPIPAHRAILQQCRRIPHRAGVPQAIS